MNYIHVTAPKAKADFGHLFEDDPAVVIARWREEKGIYFDSKKSGSFIPWHTIETIKFERNWQPSTNAD